MASDMRDLLGQSLRFAAVGVANTLIGVAAIYALMYFLRSGPLAANFFGYLIGLAFSFSLNRLWTFKSAGAVANDLPKYLLVAAASYLVNAGIVSATVTGSTVNPYLAQLLGLGAYTVSFFVGCRVFVFAAPENRSDRAPATIDDVTTAAALGPTRAQERGMVDADPLR
jgi:putative flippase GtrA